jgi:hypothetical protein
MQLPQTTSKTEPSIWSDLLSVLRRKRDQWQKKNRSPLRRAIRDPRVSQTYREVERSLSSHTNPETLEPGFAGLRVWILLFFVSAVLLFAGVQFGGRFGLVIGFVATLVLNLWILFISPSRMIRDLSTWELEGRDAWGLLESARDAARLAHVPPPRIVLSDTDQFFVLSVGLSASRSTIILSHGLVEKLSQEERRLIMTFETAKIASQWTASATVAAGLAALFDLPGLSRIATWVLRLSLGPGLIFEIDEWVATHSENRELWARTLYNLDSIIAAKPLHFPLSQAGLHTVLTPEMLRSSKRGAAWSALTEIRSSRYEKSLPSIRTRIRLLIDRFPP